jgi:threonine dehydrogenase-like Zn-dependent dehydrogenase
MWAVYLNRGLEIRQDYPIPSPPPGEARVRVKLAGICNTDLELMRGYLDFRGVPGHEFVGVVEEAPDHLEWVGKRVVGEINAACRVCPTCRAGRPTHCPNRTTLGISGRDGAFAEYLLLPVVNLHEVPPEIPDEAAVFVEPLAAALEILEQTHIRPTDRAVVLGDGKLGSLVAQVMQLTGCDLLVVGRNPNKLALLARRGIPVAHVEDVGDLSADVVVECTGSPEGFHLARRWVRPRGALVLKSTYHGTVEANLTMVAVDEVTVIGSRCGPFEPALRLLRQGLVDVQPLIHARYPLQEADRAFEHAARKGALKVLLEIPL